VAQVFSNAEVTCDAAWTWERRHTVDVWSIIHSRPKDESSAHRRNVMLDDVNHATSPADGCSNWDWLAWQISRPDHTCNPQRQMPIRLVLPTPLHVRAVTFWATKNIRYVIWYIRLTSYFHTIPHSRKYTVRQKKEPIFFRVHLFNAWQKLVIFFAHIKESISLSYNSACLILACVENIVQWNWNYKH